MQAHLSARPGLERELEAELDWFEARVRGRTYLVEDRFGRADITAASLLASIAQSVACPLYRQAKLRPPIEEACRG